jgi:diguanylate cyclase (GGDEF)-like protein
MNENDEVTAPARPARSFIARVSLLVAVLAAILLTVGVGAWGTINRFANDSGMLANTYDVEEGVFVVIARLGTLQANALAYATTGEPSHLSRFTGQLVLLDEGLKTLGELVRDEPAQVEPVRGFAAAVRQQRNEAVAAVEARRSSGKMPVEAPNLGVSTVQGMAHAVLDPEDDLQVRYRLDIAHTATMARLLISAAISLSLCFLGFTYWLVRVTYRRTSQDRRELRATNAQLGDALAETQRISESMQKLSEFGQILQSCHSIDEVREGLPSVLGELLPQLGGRLALINASQNLAAIGAHWGRHGLSAESVFAPEDCWALRRGQPFPLAATNSGFVCKHVDYPNPEQPDAGYLCVPLMAQGETLGVLTFDADRAPSMTERRLAIAAGEQLAQALANLRLQDTLRTQSIRDPLTGLFNRRYLEVSVERELLRATRRSLSLAVLMIDIDNFKAFNDTHGHEAGDAVLAQFAEVLKRATRIEDIACRHGGEEFVVLLQEADEHLARKSAERIRAKVAEMNVMHRQVQLPRITVSIGLAEFPRDGRTQQDLLRRADTALYLAKKAGRDCVASAESDETLELN